jgi:hypothetical protein
MAGMKLFDNRVAMDVERARPSGKPAVNSMKA